MHDDAPKSPSTRARIAFLVISIAMTALAVTAVARAMLRRSSTVEAPPGTRADLASLAGHPHLMFRSVDSPQAGDFGKVALAPLDPATAARQVTPLSCARLYFAAGQGICLAVSKSDNRKVMLQTFGPDVSVRWSHELSGLPSRARVSRDGRYGAVTIFVTGHMYSDEAMSTQTLLVDMAGDRVIGDLEEFEIRRDGARLSAPDINIWGVTFGRDANRFYATLATDKKTWLVEGDIAARTMRTLRENVECPSLSPDGTRLGFKKRVAAGPGSWRLHVLDLATLDEHELTAEERPIDDQVEWLDDAHLVYKHGADVWMLPVDGSAAPRKFLPHAASPVVVRTPS